MAYAVSESDAAKAPKLSGGEESYVQQMYLKGRKYYLYIHSYLHYGLLAAGAEILKIDQESGSPCLLAGYDGSYKYGPTVYKASASPSGSSHSKCREAAIKALKVNESWYPYEMYIWRCLEWWGRGWPEFSCRSSMAIGQCH